MERKDSKEESKFEYLENLELKEQEDKKTMQENFTNDEHRKNSNNMNVKRQNLNHLISEQNYMLVLDESGNPKIDVDNVFIIPNETNLIVKIFNGSKVSKNPRVVCDRNMDNSLNKKRNCLSSLNVESNYSDGNSSSTIKPEEEKEVNIKIGSKCLYKTDPNEQGDISLHELKEISKLYNLTLNSFKSVDRNGKNIDSKINLHEKIDMEKVKIFEQHLIYPIVLDTDIYFIIPCNQAGPITFFLLFESDTSSQLKPVGETLNSSSMSSSESFESEVSLDPFLKNVNLYGSEITVLIEPNVKINNVSIDIESLSIQTILSKSLGKLEDWEEYFKEASALNYNFIHFTPIQMIGKSDSLYCLRDQTEINDTFFDGKISKEEKFKLIKEKLQYLKEKYKIKCLVDIVLNHTAIYSEWLLEHPESGYNLENCPYLTVSYELDCLILDYSHRFSQKKCGCKSAPFIYNENDLNDLIGELSNEIYRQNFEEFFLISIENNIADFIQFFQGYKKNFQEYLNKKKYLANKLIEKKLNFSNENDIYHLISESMDNYGAARYGVKVNSEFISILLIKDGFSENQFLAEVKKFLNRLNDDWRVKCKEFLKQAIENIKATIRYEFIQLKNNKVTDKKRLVENYFTTFEPNNKKAVFACNGWLFGVSDPTVNFAKYGFWNYFNRSIVIWGDCVKLNFGEKEQDSPYLWEHMTEYVTKMAEIFDGFRLDNAHSTPIFLAETLIKRARKINQNLVIIAELFAGTKEREIEFVKSIGINLLIREIIYCCNPDELCESLFKFGGGNEKILGKLDESCSLILDSQKIIKYKKLIGRKPKSVLFDITHDNPTLYEKYGNLGLNLTYMCCNSMSGTSIGTTRGFDQLYPYQPSVVKEGRLYNYDCHFHDVLEKFHKFLGDYSYNEFKKDDCENIEEKNTKLIVKNENISETKEIDTSTIFEFIPNNAGINYSPNKVCLAISINSWKPDIILEKLSNNLFRTKLQIDDGVYEYKYVVDNNWMFDKSKPIIKDRSGNINNQIIINKIGNISSHNSSGNSLSNVITHDFYTNQKDLKLIRRELNHLRRAISEKSDGELSEFLIHKDRDILYLYRSLFSKNENFFKYSNVFDGYAMILRCGFDRSNNPISTRIELPGIISEFVFFTNISIPEFDLDKIRSESKLIGVDSNSFFSKNIKNLYEIAKISRVNGKDIIDFHSIRPNTCILLKVRFYDNVKNAIEKINEKLDFIANDPICLNFIKNIDLCDLNHALFKCEAEELANTNKKRGNYEIQEIGKLVYAGISHLHLLLQQAKISKKLDHKVFDNVRQGDWLIKYTIDRLKDSHGLLELANLFSMNIYPHYQNLPVYLKPHYLTRIIDVLYDFLIRKLFFKIEEFMELDDKGEFFKSLMISNLQFLGNVESSKFKDKSNAIIDCEISVAAGLPHFSTEYMRCWGRDTFISFKGLFLIPGFYKEAKQILINFSSTMRHGLIPNLLDSGINPRFNSRDAVWFYLQAIKDYISFTDDYDFMNHEVKMVFLDDDMVIHFEKFNKKEKKIMRIQDIVLVILTKHVNGIDFREWRAGKQIDEHMRDEGFNIKITFDQNTGFIYGGNQSNCGTWMDKMGSSQKANNKGVPSTPRNGANVELIGLMYSVITYFNQLHYLDKKYMNQNHILLDRFKILNSNKLQLSLWSSMIKDNFEKNFFVNKKVYINNLTTKENHYKDYISNSEKKYQEYQLRPNFLIAMAIAPDLFTKEKALKALEIVEKYLLVENAMGVRTLDYEDNFYRGNYDNSNDTNDHFTAHGFNYHNGPEWVWPIGYYIIARCNFNNFYSKKDLKRYICSLLIPHYENILNDAWRGIPELTDKNNKFCVFSCRTQAWSIATILDGLNHLIDL